MGEKGLANRTPSIGMGNEMLEGSEYRCGGQGVDLGG